MHLTLVELEQKKRNCSVEIFTFSKSMIRVDSFNDSSFLGKELLKAWLYRALL